MSKRDRIFAGFGAALFLVTSSALAIAVIVISSQNSSTPTSAPASPTASKSTSSSNNSQSPKVGSKLQGFTPLTAPLTKLEISDLQKGTGALVSPGDTVTANYVGALASNGIIFDTSASHGGPIAFSLSKVIAGWQQGIPGMRVGGSRELLVPAAMAYGAQGSGTIPANADLVFLVTIVSTKK